MSNFYVKLLNLIPQAPLQVGTVVAVNGGVATVELPGGGLLQARGTPALNSRVFVRAGAIEGEAPDLPVFSIEI